MNAQTNIVTDTPQAVATIANIGLAYDAQLASAQFFDLQDEGFIGKSYRLCNPDGYNADDAESLSVLAEIISPMLTMTVSEIRAYAEKAAMDIHKRMAEFHRDGHYFALGEEFQNNETRQHWMQMAFNWATDILPDVHIDSKYAVGYERFVARCKAAAEAV